MELVRSAHETNSNPQMTATIRQRLQDCCCHWTFGLNIVSITVTKYHQQQSTCLHLAWITTQSALPQPPRDHNHHQQHPTWLRLARLKHCQHYMCIPPQTATETNLVVLGE
ncbi:unnamed protein product, partial [Ectocarpus sp. 4 AP-2014]